MTHRPPDTDLIVNTNMDKGRLKFELEQDGIYSIENGDGEFIGSIEKLRIGAWMSWCLLLEHECYMSAGCLDEVRAKIKELNATANKPNRN